MHEPSRMNIVLDGTIICAKEVTRCKTASKIEDRMSVRWSPLVSQHANGKLKLLDKMSAQLAPLSASVTRILSLTGFPKELKTKDIQSAFSDWENVAGGFRIKWIDDTSLMIVFNDAGVGTFLFFHS